MTSRLSGMISLVLSALLWMPPDAWTADLRSVQATPGAGAVLEERGIEFVIRFDRPVDHVHSFLAIVRDGKVIETLRPRLEVAPNVLFARTATPAPGDYILHWTVLSSTGGDVAHGEIPFTVMNMR